MFFGQDSASGQLREQGDPSVATKGTTLAVHPFAPLRDRVYRFAGGDTVAVIQTGERAVTVVRVQVDPRAEQADWPVVVFRGEINLDAEMGEIVRMRGQFLTLGQRGPQRQRAIVLPISVKAYVDLESVLVDGRYWLPRQQRIEQHVNVGGLAEGRSVFRIVSRFGGHRVLEGSAGDVSLFADEGTEAVHALAPVEPMIIRAHRLTIASSDSLGRPRTWLRPLGEATADLRGEDFDDVGAGWNGSGSMPIAWRAQRLADVVHFNRVEGWTTGAAIEADANEWLPGLRLRANAGWAWTERTFRGRVEALRSDSTAKWTIGARAGRTLDITNDFTAPHDSGGSILEALGGVDRYDYVDRRAATVWLNLHPMSRATTLRLEAGFGSDHAAPARLTRGLWVPDIPFAPNRGMDEGRYVRAAIQVEWNPAVTANALVSGIGAQVGYETASGQLDWERATMRTIARKEIGPIAAAARFDAGVLISSDAPPQQLFEMGGDPLLPGYTRKEFAGDRAIMTQWRLAYRLPVLRSPLRLLGCTCFTAPAPALAVTLHGGYASASRASTMGSIARLGSVGDQVGEAPATPGSWIPVSRPTAGWIGSTEIGLRLFGGAATLGAVRINEPGAPWRARFTLGQSW
jgi:hypothetical protein